MHYSFHCTIFYLLSYTNPTLLLDVMVDTLISFFYFINKITKLINENHQTQLSVLKIRWLCLLLSYIKLKMRVRRRKSHAEGCLTLRKSKDIEGLSNETLTIQKRLLQRQKAQAADEKAKIFAKLVLEGKVNAAFNFLMMRLALEFCRFHPT